MYGKAKLLLPATQLLNNGKSNGSLPNMQKLKSEHYFLQYFRKDTKDYPQFLGASISH